MKGWIRGRSGSVVLWQTPSPRIKLTRVLCGPSCATTASRFSRSRPGWEPRTSACSARWRAGEHREGSDVDLLVDLAPGVTLFDLSRLRRELSELLGVPVDIVSSRALLPRDQDVLDEAIAL